MGRVVIIFNILILGHFHNRFWLPVDEGQYAHVAERILNGEVLNRDIQELGYINFLNAAALGIFGRNLVSMRYPLIADLLSLCSYFFFSAAEVYGFKR